MRAVTVIKNAVGSGVNLECTENYTISGGGFAHVIASRPSNVSIRTGKTITLIGTPVFGIFAFAANAGVVAIDGTQFNPPIGAATGSRYNASFGGQIYTGTAGANLTYLPGSTLGSATNFGTAPFGLYY